ncbi:unnamed protein product [Diatraea saccharalis]|uniref:Uncharacterized protein n=1 Tax=Diatraea saccharalis TaxID=40085 RepID=A0A9N9RC10_9NEOP|nr:unnamed protein product [Diatraea saccharalis]
MVFLYKHNSLDRFLHRFDKKFLYVSNNFLGMFMKLNNYLQPSTIICHNLFLLRFINNKYANTRKLITSLSKKNIVLNIKLKKYYIKYYRLGDRERQWQFIVQHTSAEPIKRITLDRKNNIIQSVKYYLPINNTKLQVCRLFFKNTLNVIHQTIYSAL